MKHRTLSIHLSDQWNKRVLRNGDGNEPSHQQHQACPPHKGGVMLKLDGFPTAVGSLAGEGVALDRYVPFLLDKILTSLGIIH